MMIKNLARPSALLALGCILLAGCATQPLSTAEAQAKAADIAVPGNVEEAVRFAQLQRVNGDIDGAVRTLSQLVIAAPDDPRVLGEYGKVMVMQGRSDDALAFLQRAIQLNPND